MDIFSEEKRSQIMAKIHSKDTKPEKIVRKLIRSLGYRFRLHKDDLPGKPDLVFSGRKKVIFVHGCFWHGHNCRRGARSPKSNSDYWKTKIERNKMRDLAYQKAYKENNWESLVIWECDIKKDNFERLKKKFKNFLINRTVKLSVDIFARFLRMADKTPVS